MKRIVRMIGNRGVFRLEDGTEVPLDKYVPDAQPQSDRKAPVIPAALVTPGKK